LKGVAKNYAIAAGWYRKAAERGSAKSQVALGTLYCVGLGVPKNAEEAVHWFHESAVQGNALAQFNLGAMYLRGEGVPKDAAKAAEWTQKAANQGSADAQFSLGVLYSAGQGVDKNQPKAVEWMRKAAAKGYCRAQLILGVWYADGVGVPKDLEEGFAWLNLGLDGINLEKQNTDQSIKRTELGIAAQAAGKPYEDYGFELFERLKTELSPEQIVEAQKRIATFAKEIQDHQRSQQGLPMAADHDSN
jgi:TPR repeat protein